MSHPGLREGPCRRKISRTCLLSLFRPTAFPTLRVTVTPSRNWPAAFFSRKIIADETLSLRPELYARLKSRLLVSLS